MNNAFRAAGRFFRVVVTPQAYLNLLYLLVAFPLGVFYFVLLVSGIASGLSLLIVWIGIPILALLGIATWVLAQGERLMAVFWLKENLPPMAGLTAGGTDPWARVKRHLLSPITWKSLAYLFMKFPLGLAGFVILATMLPLTVALVAMPILYQVVPDMQAGVFLSSGTPAWQIDSLSDALLVCLGGLTLWPVALHVTNGMAWVHAKFARVMLSGDPLER
jgi:hypothetical protein